MLKSRIDTALGEGELLKPANVDFPLGMGLDLDCGEEEVDVEDILGENNGLFFRLLEKFGFIRFKRTKRFSKGGSTARFFYVSHSDGNNVSAFQAKDPNNPRTYGTFFTALSPFRHQMLQFRKEVSERDHSDNILFIRELFAYHLEHILHIEANSTDPRIRDIVRGILFRLEQTTYTHSWQDYPESTILFRENFSSGNVDRLLHGTNPTEDDFKHLYKCGGDVVVCDSFGRDHFDSEAALVPGLRTEFNQALYGFLNRQ